MRTMASCRSAMPVRRRPADRIPFKTVFLEPTMIRLRVLSLALCLGFATPSAWAADPVLVIHGGAGLERKSVTPQDEAAIRAALTLALKKGHEALAAGKPAMDAVTAAITVLEDDPLFNAGKGAVFTHDG